MSIASSLSAATNYVATTGSDSTGDGSLGNPYQTLKATLSKVSAGDTIYLEGGVFNGSSYRATSVSGTSGLPITITGDTNAVITGTGLDIENPYYIVDGLTFSNTFLGNQYLPSALVFGRNADYTVVKNCTFKDMTTGVRAVVTMWNGNYTVPPQYVSPDMPAHDTVVSNCVFDNVFGCETVQTAGSNNVVRNSTFNNLQSSDVWQVWGTSNHFEFNYVTNGYLVTGGVHPDIVQTYGSNLGLTPAYSNYPCMDSYGNYVNNNQVWSWHASFCQLEARTTNQYYALPHPIRVEDLRVENNLFVDCGNEGMSASAGSIDIPSTKWINNTFVFCATNASSPPLGFVYYQPGTFQNGGYRGAATNSLVLNNAFIGCGTSSKTGWYYQDYATDYLNPAPSDLIADFNYVVNWDGANWGTKSGFSEVHGLNPGTNPKLVDFGGNFVHDYKPVYGSPLIDAGTNYLSNDYDGLARPMGSTSDIGCFEFDPNLLMHFDFDENPIAAHKVQDVTGYGHDAMQMDPTNFLQTTASVNGTIASLGTVVAQVPDANYNYTWYGAITNLGTGATTIRYLTNGTFCSWVRMAPNGERWDTILDCGFSPAYVANVGLATNSWCVSYGSASLSDATPSNFWFRIYGDASATNDLHHPSSQWPWPYLPRDGTTWMFLTAVWQSDSNIVLYANGQPVSTNAFNYPWLQVNGNPTTPWMALNIQTHGGTPQWGDDLYPNYGALKGSLDDVRLYNRPLSAKEVANLYSANEQVISSGGGGPRTSAPTVALTASPSVITQGQSATLSWTSANATNVNLAGVGSVALNGSLSVQPTTTTTYSITATGVGGSQNASTTITVTTAQATNLIIAAASGQITKPFVSNHMYIYQSIQTLDPTNGGQATYIFNISEAGDYCVEASVNAPNDSANSLFVNIDSQPQDPDMIWDIPLTTSFETRTVSWRGNGAPNEFEYVPKIFTLAAGQHELIIRGREAGVQLQTFFIVQVARPAPPTNLIAF